MRKTPPRQSKPNPLLERSTDVHNFVNCMLISFNNYIYYIDIQYLLSVNIYLQTALIL